MNSTFINITNTLVLKLPKGLPSGSNLYALKAGLQISMPCTSINTICCKYSSEYSYQDIYICLLSVALVKTSIFGL